MSQSRRHGAYQGKLTHLRQTKSNIRLRDLRSANKEKERNELGFK